MTELTAPRPPAWERLRAPQSGRLTVAPLERRTVEVLRVVDGELPEMGGATVVWAQPLGDRRVRVRAARIVGEVATPFVVEAARLDIALEDAALARLLGRDVPLASPAEAGGCSCKGTTAAEVAAAGRWGSVDAVKRATKAGFGLCQGRRCVGALGAALHLEPNDPRSQITARPPLVPLPAVLLAAFAEDR